MSAGRWFRGMELYFGLWWLGMIGTGGMSLVCGVMATFDALFRQVAQYSSVRWRLNDYEY